jgi:nickel-dependent lactate racemase
MDITSPKIFKLAYGADYLDLKLDSSLAVDVINPLEIPSAGDPIEVVRESLDFPIDGLDLSGFSDAKTVAITINDKTRPVPHKFMLPPLLDKLIGLGFASHNIQLIIATGTHKPMPVEEYEKILPRDIFENFPVVSHDCDNLDNLVFLGETSRKTPVFINRQFIEADLRVALGNIEPHHFMGFSGGAKSMSIGLAGRETINKNHAMLIDPRTTIGEYEDNPMRQDVEEIGQIAGLHYAVNVILNSQKDIVKSFAGAPLDVMKAGIQEVRRTGQVSIQSPYDVVIASVGGAPKDINLYQSQKAITHAAMCVRDGGAVILAAKCPEGSGSMAFEEFMHGITSLEDVFQKFNREGFKVGPHKAFQIARLASRVKIILVSDLRDDLVRKWFITPAQTLEQAFMMAKQSITPLDRIAVMPRATNTIPHVIN